MDQITLLTKFKDELSAYSDFSEINYETTYVSLFERIFGKDDRFSAKARFIVSGWGVKGAANLSYGEIGNEQYNRNKHIAFLSLLDEAINFKQMDSLLTEEPSNECSCTVRKQATENKR